MNELIFILPSIEPRDPVYLTITNLLLGFILVVFAVYIGIFIFLDIRSNKKEGAKASEKKLDLKELLSRLGVTMQDGGKKIEDDKNSS